MSINNFDPPITMDKVDRRESIDDYNEFGCAPDFNCDELFGQDEKSQSILPPFDRSFGIQDDHSVVLNDVTNIVVDKENSGNV